MITVEWHNETADPEPCGSCGQVKPHQCSVEILTDEDAQPGDRGGVDWLCSDCVADLIKRLS